MPWRRISVFAVEDRAVQVTWAGLPAGPHELRAGGRTVTVEGGGRGPGATMIEGLRPGTHHVLRLDGRPAARFRTLPEPPGPDLTRLALLSDLHIGDRDFGPFIPVTERRRPGIEPFALRCARAALGEALAWGADAIVVKGDLTRDGAGDEVDDVGRLLGSSPVPVLVIAGNHELKVAARHAGPLLGRHGVRLREEPEAVDLPGVRVVIGVTARRHVHHGDMDASQAKVLARLCGDAPGPALLVLHHQLQRLGPSFGWPPGVAGPPATALLDAVAGANPATLVTSGHTHRYRLRRHGPLPVTTTGSPKDYPGAWTGLVFHEGGVRQVVRRVAAPDCIAWTQRTWWAAGGLWGVSSPGLRSHRCFTHAWPARP